MADYPPLSRYYIASYAANDRDFPVVAIRLDPRTAGYKVPEDLSPHPDSKRYPNHVFTGAQPSSGDQVVTHIYEILPAPWVPFTRYDDDLGPIQGRRRSVKNKGQVATLAADKRVTYEAREGSAIVYTEIEETWSIEVDEDGNSLFPVKDRDFYDPSRGAVQERRQLFVPTGEEQGTLENVNGVITQTSYEPYNEFLSVKIVQTYSVNGPKLIGQATDNDGQLVTVTTQRKGALNYIPPNPTATKTVEVSREDAESLVERIVDTPEVFTAKTFSVERPDPIPQKFRVAVPLQSNQEVVEGDAELPELLTGEISRSEEQRNKFIKRITSTSRDQDVLPKILTQKATDNDRQEVTITETLQEGDTEETSSATTTVESEALGDGNFVVRKTEIPEIFKGQTFRKTKEDLTPQKFRAAQEDTVVEENVEGQADPNIVLEDGEFAKSEQQINKFVKRVSTTSRTVDETEIITEEVLTPEGQKAIRRLTLDPDVQTFIPSAKLIEANVEALGDGRFVKTEVTIPEVFKAQSFSVERPDPLPQKFRVKARTLTTQETVEGTADSTIDLLAGELSKSEQQVTEFVKRTSVTSRDQAQLPISLGRRDTNNEGQEVTITETLQIADAIEQNSATVTIQSEELGDGNYLVTRAEVPEVFAGETYRKTKEDITPQKFKAAQEDTIFEQTIEGTADPNIELDDGEFAKSEQQISKFIKRVSTTSRAITSAVTLNEKVLTPQGQIGSRLLRLQLGDQNFDNTLLQSGRLIDGSVEALGDQRTILSQTSVPSVFAGKTVQKSRIDLTPEKFKAKQEDTTTEETVAGVINPDIDLDVGEFRKSEQQVTEFVKRISTTSRDITATQTLSESLVTAQGQIATRTLNLVTIVDPDNPPVLTPNELTVDASIEELGDGRVVITNTTVPDVFANTALSIERPDNVPPKFKAKIPVRTTQSSVAGVAQSPSLNSGEFAKSEQQVTEFVKRTSVTSRSLSTPQTLTGLQYTTELGGGYAVVKETYPVSSQEESDIDSPEFGTISDEIENLGDGTKIRRTVKLDPQNITIDEFDDSGNPITVPSMPVLVGQEYDEELDIVIPFKQLVSNPSTSQLVTGERRRVTPRDVAHSVVVRYDIEDVQQALDDYYWEIPDMISISLPDKLKSVVFASDRASGSSNGNGIGDTYSFSTSERSSVSGDIAYEIEQGFQGNIPTKRAIFFLPKGEASPDDVLKKLRIKSGDNSIVFWPNVRPESYQVAIVSKSFYEEESKSVSFDSLSTSSSSGGSVATKITTIPPTIHPEIAITTPEGDAVGSFLIKPDKIPKTEEETFPIGNFLYKINASPYRFSYVRVEVLLVLITSEYV